MTGSAFLDGMIVATVITVITLAFVPKIRKAVLDNAAFNWIRNLNKSSGD